MMAKRVIPCLDVHAGQVTRGIQFGKAEAGELRNVGDPVELALRYNEQGADEMVFFDITASAHGRATMVSVIERAAEQCFMPLTVGGGLRSVEDMYTMLRAGADKISINSSALANPNLIRSGAEKFRSSTWWSMPRDTPWSGEKTPGSCSLGPRASWKRTRGSRLRSKD